MNHTRTLILPLLLAATLVACRREAPSTQIIIRKPVREVVDPRPHPTGDTRKSSQISWQGTPCLVEVSLEADTTASTVAEGTRTYYDNRARLVVRTTGGREMVSRSFSRSDFAPYLDAGFMRRSVLSALTYIDQTADHRLRFAASVGSPDRNSDEYVSLILLVSPSGAVQIERDEEM